MKLIYPPALRTGDLIGLVAPAGVVDRVRAERAIERLEQLGFRTKTYGDVYRTRGYLAGEDAERAGELNAAMADSETAAVFPVRGGYGLTRILHRLDFGVLRHRPKVVVGFSDITALHQAIFSQTGLVTFHSPNLIDGLGMPDGLSDFSADTFWRAVLAERYDTENGYIVPISEQQRSEMTALVPGVARGRIVGGNLALVAAVLGTPFEVDTTDCLLLLEDVGEAPYRIDRYLSQLRLAGKLDRLSGVLLGQFNGCEPPDEDPSLTLPEVLDDYFGDLGVPVLQNFPLGHVRDNGTLPLGALAQIDADRGEVRLLENPVQLTDES